MFDFRFNTPTSFPESGSRKHFRASGMRGIDFSHKITPRYAILQQKINHFESILESSQLFAHFGSPCLGFNDDELSLSVWETCRECKNFVEMGEMIRQTKLREFVFPEELVFDMWGIIDDWKNGLLEPQKEISEKEVAGGDVTKEGAGTSESIHHYWTSIETNVDEADLKEYERNSKPINDIEDVQNKD